MTRYELLRLLHILGAIAWIGSGVGLFGLSRQLHAAGEHAALLAGIRQSKALGNRVFVPAALVTLLSGVGLILLEGAARFADAWIVAGIAGVVASGVVVGVISGPAERQLADETIAPDVRDAAIRRMQLGNVMDIGVLVAVVVAMVLRPTW